MSFNLSRRGLLGGLFAAVALPIPKVEAAPVEAVKAIVKPLSVGPYDAGLFYCPYIPLQMVAANGDGTITNFTTGFKTRYGIVR